MSKKRALALAGALTGMVALALAGSVVQMRAALAQTSLSEIRIASRERTVAGQSQGEVLIGDEVVFRLRSSAGGLTARQRATAVANRLEQLRQDNLLDPQRITHALLNGQWVVMSGGQQIVTADAHHASLNGVTPRQLANTWAGNLASALSAQVAGTRETPTLAERTSDRIVPIVSIGSGLRVGGARISGPASRVAQTSVVGQLETTFQDVVRIRIFVPLAEITRLERVPQVNVNAYGDINL